MYTEKGEKMNPARSVCVCGGVVVCGGEEGGGGSETYVEAG